MSDGESRVTAIMITHNRREEVLRSLEKLGSLPERPPIVLVDNGSLDGTAEAVSRRFPRVEIIRCCSNLGAAARNLGVRRARTPYVALCDDDTWWQAGCLARAAELLDAHPNVAVLTARLLNGPEEIEDTICQTLEASPLPTRGPLPGKPLLGFLAGASVVRREAFLAAGGFDHRFFIGGEEELLAIELAVAGWALCYVPELVVHHYPSAARDRKRRDFHVVRNRLWVSWLKRPAVRALVQTLVETLAALRSIPGDWQAARALVGALAGLPWILRERRVVPAELEEQLSLLETT
jgi:GT2 family glycosyltransferase